MTGLRKPVKDGLLNGYVPYMFFSAAKSSFKSSFSWPSATSGNWKGSGDEKENTETDSENVAFQATRDRPLQSGNRQ